MIHPRFGFSPDPERNIAHDIVHDGFDPWADFTAFCVGQNGKVAAGDIETNAGQRNLVFVSNDATDGLRITSVPVGTKHSTLASRIDTSLDLAQGRLIMLAEYFCFHSSPVISSVVEGSRRATKSEIRAYDRSPSPFRRRICSEGWRNYADDSWRQV